MKIKIRALMLAVIMGISLSACGGTGGAAASTGSSDAAKAADASQETQAAPGTDAAQQSDAAQAAEAQAAAEAPAEKNGEIYILVTSDVHCGVDKGFGYAGLQQIRDSLEQQGYETILVDDGDSIQGEALGTLSKGEAPITLMNEMGYDVAIPGNHEFDYGTDRFLELTKTVDFPYISCNFTHEGELVFPSHVTIEAAGRKIGFVGVTTPKTVTSSSPANFQDESGNFVYSFMQEDRTGGKVYQAVQQAADEARAEGAELVYVMGHLGNEEICRPWTYADIAANTTGIDVILDGHSHDTDQIVMKNKDGASVTRTAVGTKMSCIGYSHIDANGKIVETGIWSWPNKISAPKMLGIQNTMREKTDEALGKIAVELNRVVGKSSVMLTLNDPEATDASGHPIRMVRRAETNLGDFCADAYRDQAGADIGFIGGGAIRSEIAKGDVTNGAIIAVNPFGNDLCVIEVTGQQILDALEWGSRSVPSEAGSFLQVSGLAFEIHSEIDSPCKSDENGIFAGIEGERRVRNVTVGGEPLDPEKKYSLAGQNYLLKAKGDGYSMFDGSTMLKDGVKMDSQVLIDYIVDTLGGEIGEEYADPYGQGRIKIFE